jgi:hypothetical protein
MRTIKLFFLLAPAFFASTDLCAQVTFGGLEPPKSGAILDLNSTVRGGLVLSNVSLDNLYTIPYSGANPFPGVNAGNHDAVKGGFAGAIVYNTNPAWGAGVYVWNGENWSPTGEDCRAPSVSLIASNPLPAQNETVTFTASSNAGGYCSDDEITYAWFISGTNPPALSATSGTTVSATFPNTGAFTVRVEAQNRYSAPQSKTIVLNVSATGTPDPQTLHYDYGFLGPTCLDVKKPQTGLTGNAQNVYNGRVDAFPGDNFAIPYTFVHAGNYSELSLSPLDPNGFIKEISSLAAIGSGNASESFTLTFDEDIRNRFTLNGADSATVKLIANYKDSLGDDKIAYLEIRLKDGFCYCPAKTGANTRVNFMCHNMGAKYDIISSSQLITRDHHGDWYKWGNSTPALKNTPENDNYNNPSAWPTRTPPVLNTWLTANNPCPAGWRRPTSVEIYNVVNNNVAYNFGLINTFSYIMKLDDLYLPRPGYRNWSDGHLVNRGYQGYYFLQYIGEGSAIIARVVMNDESMAAVSVPFSDANISIAYSVRCVAE